MSAIKKKTRLRRLTVPSIVILFCASAILRVLSGVGEASAQANSVDVEGKPGVQQSSDSPGIDLDRVLERFSAREARIEEREQQLEIRMKALKVIEEKTQKTLEQLRNAEDELRTTIALASTAAEDDLLQLTEVYEQMKPKTAAELFEKMAPQFAAGFISRMKPETVAPILSGMSPDHAYSISAIIAGRNAEVPGQ